MDNFWIVTVFNLEQRESLPLIQEKALSDFSAAGVEEYSLSEAEVDEILGIRSYSGGDLPQEVLDEVDEVVLSRGNHCRFYFERSDDAELFQKFVHHNFLCEVQLEEGKSEDWNAEWRKHYAPIKVSSELEIVPSWLTEYQGEAQHKLYIYPGMGFGTGSHETTFLCLKLFTKYSANDSIETVLDFGSGSGILGLAALKFKDDVLVDFYDIDPEANKNCYQNAEINNLADKSFRLLLPEYRDRLLAEYDVVFANILENILLLEQSSLSGHLKKGGHLIVSGLLNHQVEGIILAYEAQGLTLLESLSQGDWSAIIFKKEL